MGPIWCRGLVDLLAPVACAGCGHAVTRDGLCADCAAELSGLALGGQGQVQLSDTVRAGGAFAYAGVAAEAVKSVKLGGRHGAAAGLGARMFGALGLPPAADADWPVTWVPSTRRTRAARGFEVPRLLAGHGAVALLERVRGGPDQTSLPASARAGALDGAFRARRPVHGRVVCVDDVRTTGATARAAGQALTAAGARGVLVVTFAVAGRRGQPDPAGARQPDNG